MTLKLVVPTNKADSHVQDVIKDNEEFNYKELEQSGFKQLHRLKSWTQTICCSFPNLFDFVITVSISTLNPAMRS
jgi:hypothetical protein